MGSLNRVIGNQFGRVMEKNREDQAAGDVHSRINEFHDKFSPQLEIVSSDPGRLLAWLVLLSTLLTLLLGHIVYLSVFFLLYITWAYTDYIDRETSKDLKKDSEENEWLLEKFMYFLQQLDNESFDLELTSVPCEETSSADAEFETEDSLTTCSVVSDESDSLAQALKDEDSGDDSESDTSSDTESDSGSCDSRDSETDFELDDFEIVSKEDL